jgi:putative MATE family efflux protein
VSNREITTGLTETTKRLGSAPLLRLIVSLGLPGMVSMMTAALYNIINTLWITRLGYEAIAALTVALPFHILAVAIGAGSGVGANALASRRFGEGNIESTSYVAGQIFSIAGFFGSLYMIAAVFFADNILIICGATPDIMDYGRQYLVVISFGGPFLFFSLIATNLLRGSGDAIKPMIFSISGVVVNTILDPFLIFGIGPFPELGIRGAALATAISQFLSAGLCFYYIVARKSAYYLKLRHLKPNLPILRDIYRVGFPAMLMEFGESVTFILLNNVLSAFGSIAIAAVGLSFRIIDFAAMPIFGASQALLPIVGFNFGARLWSRVWNAVKLTTLGLALLMGIAMVGLEIFTPQLLGIFSNDPELIGIGIPAMRLIMSSLFLWGPMIIFATTFQGLSKGKDALALTLVRQFIFFVPLLYLFSWVWGLYGVWIAIPVSDLISFIVAGLWLLREYRLQRRTGSWVDLPAPDADKKV